MAAAVREAQVATLERRTAEQLSLLPGPAAAAEAERRTDEGRGPGRPKGARDRRTTDLVKFILANYRDPALFLADTFSRPLEQLAEELGCTKLEAYQIQMVAAKELHPYVRGKIAPVEGDVAPPVTFTIEASATVAAMLEAPVAEDGTVTLPVSKDFNGLADGPPPKSDSGQSDDEG